MGNDQKLARDLVKTTEVEENILTNKEIAHLFIHHNKVLTSHLLPGLDVKTEERKDGVKVDIVLKENTVIKRPVHLCFGMLPKEGVQRIILRADIKRNSKISVLAHCAFPNAVNVKHIMDGKIKVREEAEYSYFERHIHGKEGGVKVYPKALIELGRGAKFKTEFELLKGRVGLIDIDYQTTCGEKSVMEMNARINGTGDDVIKIKESGFLQGEYSRGVLTSRVALRDRARAEIYNKMTATAAYARGHVDCKEIVQDKGFASAIPVVEVKHPKAHVTHEAAIGSVDTKQLQTLMSRGLSEDEAVELIIQGLLS
ncbi:MAG: SufD family Fe-S cluster assembly protein [Spirochaetes bacterium]|nr:SufD family Fe-S cluster assembly protein [Spirochaetota bacterium]